MEFGVTAWTVPGRGVRALEYAHSLGFGYVHIDRDDLPSYRQQDVLKLRRASTALRIRLAGFAINRLESVGLADAAKSKRVVEEGVRLASLLGINYVYLPFFGAAQIKSKSDFSHAVELTKYALERSERSSTTVAVEHTLDLFKTRQLFESVGSPRARLLFDTQNPTVHGINAVELVEGVADYIGEFVHVKDGVFNLGDATVGEGRSDVRATLEILISRGFVGGFVLEGNYLRSPERALEDQRALKEIISSIMGAVQRRDPS
jgi:sugar phosphate isomerase/epimerase